MRWYLIKLAMGDEIVYGPPVLVVEAAIIISTFNHRKCRAIVICTIDPVADDDEPSFLQQFSITPKIIDGNELMDIWFEAFNQCPDSPGDVQGQRDVKV